MLRRLTAWLDPFESPGGMLTTSDQAQADRLRRTRQRWLDAVGQCAVAERHLCQQTATAARLEAQARQAVLAGRDDLALAALARLHTLRPRVATLTATRAALAQRAATLQHLGTEQQAQLSRFRRIRPLIQAAWESDGRHTSRPAP